jgi:hypothetical protein
LRSKLMALIESLSSPSRLEKSRNASRPQINDLHLFDHLANNVQKSLEPIQSPHRTEGTAKPNNVAQKSTPLSQKSSPLNQALIDALLKLRRPKSSRIIGKPAETVSANQSPTSVAPKVNSPNTRVQSPPKPTDFRPDPIPVVEPTFKSQHSGSNNEYFNRRPGATPILR